MKQGKNDQFILTLISLSCVGLTIESIMMGWEFWVPPLIIIGTIAIWVMHITGRPETNIREAAYFLYAFLAVFFHGVHESSFFDIVVVVGLAIVAYSFMDRIMFINLFLLEFLVLIVIQIYFSIHNPDFQFDALTVSRIILHVLVAISIYLSCVRSINLRKEATLLIEEKELQIEANNNDMDDFLSNISHELRTPVNVVSGMSDRLKKRGITDEATVIKEAGLRLAGQIDDIQDYTETRRDDIFLEEEDYMSTSIINDVVTGFRTNKTNNDLELVVDIAEDVPVMMRGDVKKLHKIFRHLLSNAVKFTKSGGIFVRMYSQKKEYGVNLCIEVTDTGTGMDRKTANHASKGMYQANKERNRSSGGVGLGLSIVYGFAHSMGGFVRIESSRGNGTTIRVTVPQKVIDPAPCLQLSDTFEGDVLFHVRSDKYKVPKLRDFYRIMATNLASGIGVRLYSAETVKEVRHLIETLNVKYIFMGEEEYEASSGYFDELSRGGIVVAISASSDFKAQPGSRVLVMPKPLYAYPVIKVLNEGSEAKGLDLAEHMEKPELEGIRALVVDDEPMNLVVATGLLDDYGIVTDTAQSGSEAILKYISDNYDIVFMDHMMPEMDGVEAMKQIKKRADDSGGKAIVVALTANVVSGAREMFIREGFDGFIGKPININEFERTMTRLLPRIRAGRRGENI
ncbi:MAG: response regulator [Lachnospiraceae bacterium]|nr:response regulator [Lachnospiraceae bacterium]